MRRVIVGFSTAKKPSALSWLIRKAEKRAYSHVYIRWRCPTLKVWKTFEAVKTSVQFTSPAIFKEETRIIKAYVLKVDKKDILTLEKFAYNSAGISYGFKQLGGMLIVRLFSLFGKKIKNPLKNGKKEQICSEVLFYALRTLGYDIQLNPDIVAPRDIETYVSQHKAFRQVR